MSNEKFDVLAEINPDALLADGLEDAFIGHTVNHHSNPVAVYCLDKRAQILVERDGMTRDEADEFLQYNTLSAYVGENGPIFVEPA